MKKLSYWLSAYVEQTGLSLNGAKARQARAAHASRQSDPHSERAGVAKPLINNMREATR